MPSGNSTCNTAPCAVAAARTTSFSPVKGASSSSGRGLGTAGVRATVICERAGLHKTRHAQKLAIYLFIGG